MNNLVNAHPIFQQSVNTLKQTSKDDSNSDNIEYMTECQNKSINFDRVKLNYAKNKFGSRNSSYKSVDALIQTDKMVYFIEFKNGTLDGEERVKIREKLSNSILLFSDILDLTFSNFREECVFILVYNKIKNSFSGVSKQKIADYVINRSENATCRFDLDKLKPFLVKEVKTYTPEEFEYFLNNNSFISY